MISLSQLNVSTNFPASTSKETSATTILKSTKNDSSLHTTTSFYSMNMTMSTTLPISSTIKSNTTILTTLLDIMIICDGNIDTPYDCQQCMDVAIIKYLWGSSCKAKKLLSSTTVTGRCGLDAACVTKDIGECPYNEYCPEPRQGNSRSCRVHKPYLESQIIQYSRNTHLILAFCKLFLNIKFLKINVNKFMT